MGTHKRVITSEHKEFICDLIAQYKQQNEIIRLIKEKYGIGILPNQITRIRQKEFVLIEKLRNHYLFDLTKIPIARKRERLDRIEGLYQLCDEIKNVESKINTKLKCLAAVHTEVEGRVPGSGPGMNFYATQINQFSNLTDERLKSKVKQLKSEIIDLSKREEQYEP